MTIHPTDLELRQFARGPLPADDLLLIDDHLSECAACRQRAATLNGAPLAFEATHAALTGSTSHISDEELQQLVDGTLPEARREPLVRHLSECATCSRQVDDLRSWSAATRSRRAWPVLAMAAALLLAVLIPTILWQTRGRHASSAALPGYDALGPVEQAQVRAALDVGVATLPDFIDAVSSSRETQMGSPKQGNEMFALIAPVATGTASDRPEFAWQPLPGALEYIVSVFDEQSNLIARSPSLSRTIWVPADALLRSRTYVWQVAARRDTGDVVTTPTAPAPPARFHVIDARSANVLRQAEAAAPQSHVLLGILNMSAGIRDEAVRQFEQVRQGEAGADLARRSLERLHRFTDATQAR